MPYLLIIISSKYEVLRLYLALFKYKDCQQEIRIGCVKRTTRKRGVPILNGMFYDDEQS